MCCPVLEGKPAADLLSMLKADVLAAECESYVAEPPCDCVFRPGPRARTPAWWRRWHMSQHMPRILTTSAPSSTVTHNFNANSSGTWEGDVDIDAAGSLPYYPNLWYGTSGTTTPSSLPSSLSFSAHSTPPPPPPPLHPLPLCGRGAPSATPRIAQCYARWIYSKHPAQRPFTVARQHRVTCQRGPELKFSNCAYPRAAPPTRTSTHAHTRCPCVAPRFRSPCFP